MRQATLLFVLCCGSVAHAASTKAPPAPASAWVGVVLNDDTSADSGVGVAAGASWTLVPRAGPGAILLGPTLAVSRQSDQWRDGPCNRELQEDIVELTADARFVVPLDPKRRVRAFVRTGPGVYRFRYEYRDDDCREFDDSEIDFGFMLGLGAEVAFEGGLALYGGLTGHSSDDDWIALSLGLAFPF